MPELPEVEVTRRSFVDQIAGAQIVSLRMGKPLRWPLGCAAEALVGRRVQGVRRRGKYLLLDLDQGLLLLHLGMSGSLISLPSPPPPGVHDDFDLSHFYAELHRRRAPIKQVLLAGDVVVGVGNIYASEALFRAGIRPTSKACKLSRPRTDRLYQAVREVLADAVEKGGSTLRNFSNAKGEAGHFQVLAMVYARAGQPCRVCSAEIRSIRQGQRSTFFCPHCQKP